MFILDTNNILSISDSAPAEHASQGKIFTRLFHGYPISAYDHSVVVFSKKWVTQKQWKDIGSWESVIMSVRAFALQEKPHPGHSRLWYDVLYKVDEVTGELKNIARVDSEMLPVVKYFFGSSMSALAVPSYESSLQTDNIVSFLFGIALAHGRWAIRETILQPIKITLPLTSSLFGQKDIITALTDRLRGMWIVHSVQYVQWANYEIAQIILHDPRLLRQFVLWLKPVVNISQISTYEKCKKVYESLQAYAQELSLDLPIMSVDEMVLMEVD